MTIPFTSVSTPKTPLYIRFFTLKKTFIPSHTGSFLLISRSFRCEGFEKQAFTAKQPFFVAYLLIASPLSV